MFGTNAVSSSLTFSKVIGGISKTLGIANQVIPIYNQVKPIAQNAKNIISIYNEFKGSSNSSVKNTKNVSVQTKKINLNANPVFFQ